MFELSNWILKCGEGVELNRGTVKMKFNCLNLLNWILKCDEVVLFESWNCPNEIWMFDFKLNFEHENCENQFELENCYVKTRTSQMFAHAQV